MAIDPVKIPQNVYVEDRIVGPVTLRQIIMCLIGGGTSYALWTVFSKSGATGLLSILISCTPITVMAAFAFVKINGISLFRMCLLMIERMEKPTLRVWTPRRGLAINIQFVTGDKGTTQKAAVVDKHTERIQELSQMLDEGHDDLDPALNAAVDASPAFQDTPVDPSRISVAPSRSQSAPLDGIAPLPREQSTHQAPPVSGDGLLRDIRPPIAS